jgi:hypothetical protein
VTDTTDRATSQDRMRALLVPVATLGTIALNAFAAAGLVNAVKPDVISAKYPTVLTPAAYAFTIWWLIYVGLIAFSVYQALPANLLRFRSVRSLYIFSCLLNCGWIYFWHREQVGICLGLMLALLASLFLILILFTRTSGGELFTKATFGIYAGWVTVASIVNLAVFLNYEAFEVSDPAWSVLGAILIILSAALSVIVRWKLRNYVYALAVAWGLTAIAVKQGGHTAIVVSAAIAVVACLLTSGSIVVELKDSTSE